MTLELECTHLSGNNRLINIWCVRESPDLCSVCKSVPDKKWLYSCGIFMFYARQSGGGALKSYGMNIWCVRGHLIYLVVACLCQIRSGMLPINSIHVLLHRHLSGSSLFLNKS